MSVLHACDTVLVKLDTRAHLSLADKHEKAFARRLMAAFRTLGRKLDMAAFRTELDDIYLGLAALYLAAGKLAGQSVRRDLRKAYEIETAFNLRNEEAERWAITYAAERVKDIGDETEAALRALTRRALAEGISPAQQARMIREMVGLTDRYAQAVENYRAKLTDMMARGRSPFRTVPLTPDKIDGMVGRYYNRLLNLRAQTIARTETMTAANRGQQALWEQAQRMGYLPSGQQKVWITAYDERVCPACAPLHEVPILLGSEWSITVERPEAKPLTYTTDVPPLHISCRCTMGLG